MNRIKVLFVLNNTGRSGAQTFAMNVLRNINKEKFNISFAVNVLKEGYLDEIRSYGCNIFVMPSYKVINHFSYCKAWKTLLKNNEFDIIHGHVSSSASVYLKISKKMGVHTILHSHSAGYRGNWFEVLIKKIFSKNAKKYADYLFACSDKAAERLFGRNFKELKNYFFIPNAIETNKFVFDQNSRAAIRKKYNLNGSFIIGHVGSFSPPKNHVFLIEIFRKVLDMRENSKLILLGNGPLLNDIKSLVSKYGISNSVIFVGNVINVSDYLSAMDAFVFPSLFEGLPVSVVEAQAEGLPCIISNTITSQVILTDLVKTVSINDDSTVWANHIFNNCEHNRYSYNEIIKNSDFEIERLTLKVEELYLSLLINNIKD